MDTDSRVTPTQEHEPIPTHLIPVGLLQTDPEGRCVSLNPRGSEVMGLSEAEAAGNGWLEAFEVGNAGELLSRWAEEIRSRGLFEGRLRLRKPDGTARVVACRTIRLPDNTNLPPGFLATLVDVTEWQEAENTLRRTTRELEARVQELDCLFELSRAVERSAGNLSNILQEAVNILSRTMGGQEEAGARITLTGLSFEAGVFFPESEEISADIFVHGALGGRLEVFLPSGPSPDEGGITLGEHRRLLEAVAQRLGRTTERVIGSQLLREREEEMRERLTHLTRVSAMGEMASSIAHEVNQPLTAIASYAQASRRLLEEGRADTPRIIGVLETIGEEAMRAGGIIHRLKDMVKRRESRWVECDLNALIRDAEQLASVDARLHEVALSFHLTPGLPSIQADGIQIQQVVLNLIRNGIDAVEEAQVEEGKVVVRTARVGSKGVRVSVEDNGKGISPETEAKLFDPFFTTKKGGIGMGLSISKSIATAHKGRISFSRNSEGGMTFHLTLPAFDER